MTEGESHRQFHEHLRHCTMIVSWKPAWEQTLLGGRAHPNHISPNFAVFGSLVHAAEAWMLSEGLELQIEKTHRHLYQAMLDQFSESDEYDLYERNVDAYYKAAYAKRDKIGRA